MPLIFSALLSALLLCAPASAQRHARLSPYDALRFVADQPQVQHGGVWHELRAIDNVAAADLIAFCKKEEGQLWSKRFAEDLVEMMTRMGHQPGLRVDLELRDLASGETVRVEGAAMTEDNRQTVRKSWQRLSRQAGQPAVAGAGAGPVPARAAIARRVRLADGPSLSPFRGMRRSDGGLHVQVDDDTWFEWQALDGIPAADIQAWAVANTDDWWKRITEDLPAVLNTMGKPVDRTVSLELRDLTTGRTVTLQDVEMTADKRRRLWSANDAPASLGGSTEPDTVLADAAWRADLAQLRTVLDSRFAYRHLGGVDLDGAVARALAELDGGEVRVRDVALAVQKIVALFRDGHAGVRGLEQYLAPGYAPFLMAATGDRVVAFTADRRRHLSPGHPYVVAIDGRPVREWIDAASPWINQGSPQYRTRRALGLLRSIEHFRGVMGLATGTPVTVQLAAADGTRTELELPVVGSKPLFGEWPRRAPLELPAGVRYLRIESMDDDPEFLARIERVMETARDAHGLVVDVRGNGGGSRAVLRRVMPYFVDPGTAKVVNIGAARLWKGEEDPHAPAGFLDNRFLYPANWDGWTDAERTLLVRTAREFRPEWTPPSGDFSGWHYMIVGAHTNPDAYRFGGEVVVLMDDGCFSATDIFLGALKGLPGVTLMGTASGGGSARSKSFELEHSGVGLRLASMASFQVDGMLYDGRGIDPDVHAPPTAGYFIGSEDPQLAAALKALSR